MPTSTASNSTAAHSIYSLPPDELVPLSTAGRCLPGGPVAPGTLARWRREGLLADDGELVRLPCSRRGRKLLVKPREVIAFLDRLGQDRVA